ncbi:N-acetylmuramoyl-L-alanine amidase [Mesorhizobium sp. f-mel]
MPDPKTYLFDLPARGRPEPLAIPEVWYPNVQSFWASSTSSRIFDPILGIKAVVIHATAGASSAGAMSVMQAGTASFHWLVPDENESQHGHVVWACAPEARAAWHVRNDKSHPQVNGGAKRVNHWSLGIEVVNTQAADPFSDWQVEATARIVRYCWAKYPNLKTIVSHAALDPQRRTDPGTKFDWVRFRQLVLSPAGTEAVSSMIAGVTPMGKLAPADLRTCCAR